MYASLIERDMHVIVIVLCDAPPITHPTPAIGNDRIPDSLLPDNVFHVQLFVVGSSPIRDGVSSRSLCQIGALSAGRHHHVNSVPGPVILRTGAATVSPDSVRVAELGNNQFSGPFRVSVESTGSESPGPIARRSSLFRLLRNVDRIHGFT